MKTKNIFLWLLLLLVLSACEEKEVDTYSGKEGIYFNQRVRIGNLLTDSTNFTFVYTNEAEKEAVVSIPVQLVGRAINKDRPVNIKITGGTAVEGVDFSLMENLVLPADSSSFGFEVTLKRTLELQNTAKTIEFEIAENEYFQPIITHETVDKQSDIKVTAMRHKIEFSELFIAGAAPAAWVTQITAFTPQRFFLVTRVMNISRSDFNDRSKISEVRFQYLISETRNYVREQMLLDDPDPEIFDEEGNPIF